ncbi:MAG: PRC-barrel domain-containing protein [Patescibacteria group bacterium]|jgi:sporulation protein YlmC with PRC-barrel domain
MLIQLDALKTLPVATAEDGRLGRILDLLIDPDTGELAGFWVKLDGLFAPRRALSSRDVVAYDPRAIVIRSDDVLLPLGEIKPLEALDARRDHWIGKAVRTEAGEQLGRVENLVIDTDLEVVAKLHVTSLFGPERVLARTDIVRVTRQAILVRANIASVPETVGAADTATA